VTGDDLLLDALANLPQRHSLAVIAPALWQQPDVVALWIGGSLARGEGDLYSDVDLRLAVAPPALEAWRTPDFDTLFAGSCLGRLFLPFGPEVFLHHLALAGGDIYDLWVQSAVQNPSNEAILILGCRDAELARRLQPHKPTLQTPYPPADGATIRQLLVEYWINTHKHRKVLHRGLNLLTQSGIQQVERSTLLRLWYVQATGHDCGVQGVQSIYSLTHLTRTVTQAQGAAALELLGIPLTDAAQIVHAIERMRDEVSQVGQALAASLDFVYPLELEHMVRQCWTEFRSEAG